MKYLKGAFKMENPILFYVDNIPIIESDNRDSLLEYLKNSDIQFAIINDLKDHSMKSYENQEIHTISELINNTNNFLIMEYNNHYYQLEFSNGHIGRAFKFNINFAPPSEKIYDVISPIKIHFKENE